MRAFGVPLAFLLGFSPNAKGQGTPLPMSQSFTFGMVGLAANQVARLNAVNTATAPTPGFTCSVTLSILDSQGAVLKSQSFPLDPQKAVLLDLNRSDINTATARVQIRAVIETAVSGNRADGSPVLTLGLCNPVPTLEIFDRDTGKTSIFMSDARMVPLAPPPSGLNRVPPAIKHDH